jgi:ABC-type Na+ efflux pump permease subunit
VLNTEYFIIDIKRLPFDFQPNRIIFILFLVISFIYFLRLSRTVSIFYFIIAFDIIKYTLRNITQGLGLTTYGGLLLAIFLSIGVAVYQKNIDVSRLVNERISR